MHFLAHFGNVKCPCLTGGRDQKLLGQWPYVNNTFQKGASLYVLTAISLQSEMAERAIDLFLLRLFYVLLFVSSALCTIPCRSEGHKNHELC